MAILSVSKNEKDCFLLLLEQDITVVLIKNILAYPIMYLIIY